jgi:transcriptional regulator GlxA family with amidase domain
VKIAILTFDGFNEIDSFVSHHILNRIVLDDWTVAITCPSEMVTSTNGVRVSAQQPLEFANDADAVLFGGSPRSRQIAEDATIMSRLKLDPSRQLIGSQCAGAWFLAKLGLLATQPVCTNLKSRPALEAMGIQVLDRPFVANGNVASAGGCLARSCRNCAQYRRARRGEEAVRGRRSRRGVAVRHGRSRAGLTPGLRHTSVVRIHYRIAHDVTRLGVGSSSLRQRNRRSQKRDRVR